MRTPARGGSGRVRMLSGASVSDRASAEGPDGGGAVAHGALRSASREGDRQYGRATRQRRPTAVHSNKRLEVHARTRVDGQHSGSL